MLIASQFRVGGEGGGIGTGGCRIAGGCGNTGILVGSPHQPVPDSALRLWDVLLFGNYLVDDDIMSQVERTSRASVLSKCTTTLLLLL